jgi:(2Fe-2S) ferredoxin
MYTGAMGEIRMSQGDQSAEPAKDLEFHASGFIVKVHGSWTDTALQEFRQFLRLRGLGPTNGDLESVLARAKQQYSEGKYRLSICSGQPCCARIGFDTSDQALSALAEDMNVSISKTGCQGPCKQAPVLSVRVGDRSEIFAQVFSEQDWQIILNFVKAARRSGTLLIDAGQAEKFCFDPVHDRARPGAHLEPYTFFLVIFVAKASMQ